MNVQRNPQLAEELLDALTAEIEEDRSGQHPSVTDLTGCITKSWLNWKSTTNADFGKPKHSVQTRTYFFIGLGLERALLSARREDGALSGSLDDIWYHIDSVRGGDNPELIELKSTRAAKKKFDAGEFPIMHLRQMMSYCWVKGVQEVDYAVVFLIPGEFEVWHITFDKMELRNHWRWMTERRNYWVRATADDRMPQAFKFNEDWECKDCRWKLVCDLDASTRPRLIK